MDNTDYRLGALALGLLLVCTAPVSADSTIVEGNEFAWGASIGWVNFRPDVPLDPDGAVIGETFCSGLVWSAACGWINLGEGAPDDGIHYANDDGDDFGVNNDGTGKLIGLAWGAAVGWINFGIDYDAEIPVPQVDLLTGEMSGYAWSASCGWIDLGENGTHVLVTQEFRIVDTDNDDIDDGWEREQLEAAGRPPNLSTLGSTPGADFDKDGASDVDEYTADSDPFDPFDRFRMIDRTQDAADMLSIITWTSSDRRVYLLDRSDELNTWSLALDRFLGTTASATTTVEVPWNPTTVQREYHRAQARRPLQ